MVNTIENISKLTTVSEKNLNKLVTILLYIINDSIVDNVKNNKEPLMKFDIGIGTLVIKAENDEILYRFIPSSTLESTVLNSITNGENKLESVIASKLSSNILRTYKDYLA